MKLSKNLKLLILLALIILVGFYLWRINQVVVLETKTETIDPMVYELSEQAEIIPTADPKWNLYRNFKYGFQIQYPAEWKYIRIYKNREEADFTFSDIGEDSRVDLFLMKSTNLKSVLGNLRNEERYVKDISVSSGPKSIIKVFTRNPFLDYDFYSYLFEEGGNVYRLSGGGTPLYSWYVDRMIETFEIF